ncbi:MAG: metallophosphatase family protein [Elusimicrobia bacterium]|nr:metallophosphatase family protein [Candidatus Liberimonas magnetica]
MKIGILSDIHSNIEALESVLSDACKNGVRSYIILGDIVGYGANPNEVIKVLRNQKIMGMVLGNHDIAILDNDISRFKTEHGLHSLMWTRKQLNKRSREFLKSIVPRCNYAEYGFNIYHGGPSDIYWQYVFPSTDKEILKEDFKNEKNKLVFVGHSHLAFTFAFKKFRIVNPGSIGQPRDGNPDASYVIYNTNTKDTEFRRISYDVKNAAMKIKNAGLYLFLAQRLFLGI